MGRGGDKGWGVKGLGRRSSRVVCTCVFCVCVCVCVGGAGVGLRINKKKYHNIIYVSTRCNYENEMYNVMFM